MSAQSILLYFNLTSSGKLAKNVLCWTKLPPLHGSQKSLNVSDTVTQKWTHRHTQAQVSNTKAENNPEATEEEDRGHERTGKINMGDAERNRTDVRTNTDKLTKNEGKTQEWITKRAHRRKAGKQTKTGSGRSSFNGENKTGNGKPKHDNVVICESVTGHCTSLLTDHCDKQTLGEVEHHCQPVFFKKLFLWLYWQNTWRGERKQDEREGEWHAAKGPRSDI